jgi:uncharacterized protein (DUF1015 family)
MAQIKPFNGLLYNKKKISDFKKVVAPPYDVISPEERDALYRLSPYNVIRLILGKETGKDSAKNNKYTRARETMAEWVTVSVLVKDDKPAIYIYRQTYKDGARTKVRTGFISIMKIEDPDNGVLPHEKTLAKPKIDRLNLIKEVRANLSPIFSLYYDKKRATSRLLNKFAGGNPPAVDISVDGVTHQLWRLTDVKAISAVRKDMAKRKIVIADGHHRYEVARGYRNLMRWKKNYNKNVDYVMNYFTNIEEAENVTIFATHRLLKNTDGFDPDSSERLLKPFFDVSYFTNLKGMYNALTKNCSRPSFGIYAGDRKYILIVLKKGINLTKVIPGDKSPQWKELDVAVLHELVIKNLLCLKDSEDNVKYVRGIDQADKLVKSGDYKIAFFLNPTRAKQVQEVAEKGDTMPQKSTYFYPKLLTGLVINKF